MAHKQQQNKVVCKLQTNTAENNSYFEKVLKFQAKNDAIEGVLLL